MAHQMLAKRRSNQITPSLDINNENLCFQTTPLSIFSYGKYSYIYVVRVMIVSLISYNIAYIVIAIPIVTLIVIVILYYCFHT